MENKNNTDSEKYLNILSLGAGVQSTTLLLMSSLGLIEKYDYAIFSDTGNEPQEVYDHLQKIIKNIAEPAGIKVFIVQKENILDYQLKTNITTLPYHTRDKNNKKGITVRGCTSHFKVYPVRKKMKELLGATYIEGTNKQTRLKKGQKVNLHIGISLDEIHRAKDSQLGWIINKFPLLDKKMTRKDCIEFLKEHGYENTPKSSCIVCPFKSNKQWREMKKNKPEEFRLAVDFEKKVNEHLAAFPKTKDFKYYLHKDGLPLEKADLEIVSKKEALDNQQEIDFTCSPFTCKADEEDFLEQYK